LTPAPKGADWEGEWNALFARYRAEYPDAAAELDRRLACGFPPDWEELAWNFIHATQERGEEIRHPGGFPAGAGSLQPHFPSLVGGSADLTESTGIPWIGCRPVDFEHPDGNLIYYGAREFAMNAIMNGLALHGGYVPFGGTFLMFADYGRSAIRMSALMKLRCVFVLTHDSIGVGGDGPDPSAGRACRQPADYSRPVGVADLRHHGNGGGLESGAGATLTARPP
jgi:transketolase